MQLVHTVIRLLAPSTFARTACRFAFQRRRVLLFACDTLFPNCGPLPQNSHLAAMVLLQSSLIAGAYGRPVELQATINATGKRLALQTGVPHRCRRNGTPALLKAYHAGRPRNHPPDQPASCHHVTSSGSKARSDDS